VNIDTQLDVIDLTTLERVRELIPQNKDDKSADELMARLITDQSAMIGRHIGLHLSSVARVEVYELRQHARVLTLDAKPVSAITTIRENPSIPDDWTTIADTSSSLYALNSPGGWIRFLKNRANDPGYIQVSYTGGFGVATANIITDFPEIAQACELAVKYEMERLNTLGGDITTIPGASTTFNAPYMMHKEVERLLGYHRRASV
jgi:hypothetical protein